MSRSVSITEWMLGRRTLTTTAVPSCRVARWACPMEALASGSVSKLAKISSGLEPSSSSTKARMVAAGTGAAASCSLASS